jgi:cytochrome c556
MMRHLHQLLLVIILGAGVLMPAAQSSVRHAETDDLPSIADIMKKAHNRSDGCLEKIAAAATRDQWDDASKNARELTLIADALGKNKPKLGDEKSWAKLCKKYGENVKAVADATEMKDTKAVNTALGMLRNSCGDCHSTHRPKK